MVKGMAAGLLTPYPPTPGSCGPSATEQGTLPLRYTPSEGWTPVLHQNADQQPLDR